MIQLTPARDIKPRQMIRVRNQGVGVLAVMSKDGVTRIRYLATRGEEALDVPSDSLVPLYQAV